MPETIAKMTAGGDTVTLRKHINGFSVSHTTTILEIGERQERVTVSRRRYETESAAAVAFTQYVMAVMTAYSEAPCAAAQHSFKKKVCA